MRRSCRTTGGGRTQRSPWRAPGSDAAREDSAAGLSRPAAGDRDRAPRVSDALVAGDVRARALQAVRDMPGSGARLRARSAFGGISDLLSLRAGLACEIGRA